MADNLDWIMQEPRVTDPQSYRLMAGQTRPLMVTDIERFIAARDLLLHDMSSKVTGLAFVNFAEPPIPELKDVYQRMIDLTENLRVAGTPKFEQTHPLDDSTIPQYREDIVDIYLGGSQKIRAQLGVLEERLAPSEFESITDNLPKVEMMARAFPFTADFGAELGVTRNALDQGRMDIYVESRYNVYGLVLAIEAEAEIHLAGERYLALDRDYKREDVPLLLQALIESYPHFEGNDGRIKAKAEGMEGPYVLAIDDTPGYEVAIARQFPDQQVIGASSPLDALSFVRLAAMNDVNPLAIITDYVMPYMEGDRFAEHMRMAGYRGPIILNSTIKFTNVELTQLIQSGITGVSHKDPQLAARTARYQLAK